MCLTVEVNGFADDTVTHVGNEHLGGIVRLRHERAAVDGQLAVFHLDRVIAYEAKTFDGLIET